MKLRVLQILLILGLVGLDQYTKYLARENWSIPVEVLSFFQLRWVENTGVAFSLPVPQLLVIGVTGFVLGYLIYELFIKKSAEKEFGYIYLLIFAGALGNLIDRIHHQSVTDFLSFWSFPIFNFADIYISVGVFLYLISEVLSDGKRGEKR